MSQLWSLFSVFFRLGWVSFGGPMAHLGYFHREFVQQRQWLSEQRYAELLALCHFLPGPASSQMGMAIGHARAGIPGSLAAFVGFTLPSALLMIAAALWLQETADAPLLAGAIHGLKLLAVVVVADAVWKMTASACPDRLRLGLALATAAALLVVPGMATQLTAIALGAAIGALLLRTPSTRAPSPASSTRFSGGFLLLFLLGLMALPLLSNLGPLWAIADAFYRAGALVFGGGHVVLPLLNAQPLIQQQLSPEQFLAGYSLAQAVPGPMFTLAAYLGTVIGGGIAGGLVALAAIFLPGWLLLLGILPLWQRLRGQPRLAGTLLGVNAVTVGLLLAAFYDPVFSSSVRQGLDLALVLAGWFVLTRLHLPISWLVAAMTAAGSLQAYLAI